MDKLINLWQSTGFYHIEAGQLVMIVVGLVLLWLAIKKGFEPLLLVPIGVGGILSNIPAAGLAESAISHALHFGDVALQAKMHALLEVTADTPYDDIKAAVYGAPPAIHDQVDFLAKQAGHGDGLLYMIYTVGLTTGLFPLLIFMGVGAMTDFGPLLANPKTLLLGAAAQFGIFAALLGALGLSVLGIVDFSLADAASIGIIGGADGPTAIFVASKLSPDLLGAIAVAAYSYMALVPIIQPPIMRLLTSKQEREIEMTQLRYVSTREKIIFPLVALSLCALLLPSAAPLIGMFMFGNLAKECGVINRLSDTIQKSLINTVTIFLGLSIGSKLAAGEFLNIETVGILILGMIAFSVGTATGVLMAKLMNNLSSAPINPLIGAAGVSAVPMAARVVNKVGLEYNSQNHLLMHAMGPNIAGVIGSAVAAGVMIKFLS
mgnify:CR=1 FL=1